MKNSISKCVSGIIAIAISFSSQLLASTSEGLPWEQPLDAISRSLQSPVAKAVGVIAIASTGLALAMGESGGVFRRLIQVVFGLSIAFAAATWGVSFLGLGSGMLLP